MPGDFDDPINRSRRDLERVSTFLSSIVENIPAMIFVKNAETLRFELFNKAGEELLGIPRESMIGKADSDFFPPDQAAFFEDKDRGVLRGGKLVDIPLEPIDTRTGRRWLHTKKIPVLDKEGVARFLLGISLDITDRHEAEEALRRAQDELERRVVERTRELSLTVARLEREISDREKAERALQESEGQLRHAQKMEAVGRLAGGVAHDFNNLLTVILGYASLLLGYVREPGAAREGLEQIRRAGEQAASLTQNLLAFSRKSPATPVRIDVGATVRQLEPMVRRFCGDGVQLALEVDSESCHVSLGEGQLEQVLLNLVINARDAMPEGGDLRLTCGAERVEDAAVTPSSLAPGTYAVIRVADTGVGMDEATRAHVFEPFFTTKPVGRGTGLGLATVYGIVTQHGGTVAVSSTRGEGSCFTVWLPVATGEVRAVGASGADAAAATGQVVLVVEDEADLRRLAVVVLRGAGFEVIEAASGPEALHLVEQRTERLDLVLTDIVMPGMDGYTLARRLRDLRRHLPVAFMSGYVEPTAEAHAPGDSSLLLRKPFTPAGLLSHVRQVLAKADATPVV